MPRHESSRLKLSYGWLRGEDWWGDPVSDNFTKLDMLTHPFVLSITETVAPLNVTIGDMYIVGVGATGDWGGHDNDLAVITEDGWMYCTPVKGVRVGVLSLGWYWFNGTEWEDEAGVAGELPTPLGSRYDIAMFVTFEAFPTEIVLVFTVPEAMTLVNGATDSVGRAVSAPTGIMRLAMKRNGTDIGTITYTSGSVMAEFTVVGDKVFAPGDLLTVHVPANPPAGFNNYSATIRMTLNNTGDTP